MTSFLGNLSGSLGSMSVANDLEGLGRSTVNAIGNIPNDIFGTSHVRTAPNGLGSNSPGVSFGSVPQADKPSTYTAPTPSSVIDPYTGQIASLLKSIQAEEQANAPGVAATLNINALNSQAQQKANSTVNPLYTNYLNQYLQQEAANKQAAQAQNQLNLQAAQTGLGKTLSANQLQAQQTSQQNALQQGNINVQQQNYELQSGNAQAAKMQALGQSVGSGNLGTSGLGQQQLYEAENARNIADAAQRGQFQYQRDTSNLSANDTFAQLAQSSQYAQTQEGQSESQLNFNLNDYLRQAAYNDSQYKQGLEAQRQQAVTAATQNDLAQGVQGAINASGVTGKNLVATNQAYSPYLQTTSMPSSSDVASLGNQFSTANYGSAV